VLGVGYRELEVGDQHGVASRSAALSRLAQEPAGHHGVVEARWG
jgi:hypothetical protein